MATHRAMQAAGATVTASAPMSGPYTLAAFGDAIFYGHVPFSAPVNLTLLVSSYQHAYGNIYASRTDSLSPITQPTSRLSFRAPPLSVSCTREGKLPPDALFSATPPAPNGPRTRQRRRPKLAPIFAMGFGPDNLILNAYRLAYLEDARAAPDGGFPTDDDGPASGQSGNTVASGLKTE